MKWKHAQKNFGAVGAMAPTPLSLKTRGGGGGLGGVAYKDWARPPPRGQTPPWLAKTNRGSFAYMVKPAARNFAEQRATFFTLLPS